MRVITKLDSQFIKIVELHAETKGFPRQVNTEHLDLLQAHAETKGFEPLVGLLRRTLSKRVRSTTPARFLLTYLTFVVE